MAKQLKKWQGWTLFGGAMVVVFLLGLLVSSLMERRAEVASVFNNKRTVFEDSIVAQNEKFKTDYPREYETWAKTPILKAQQAIGLDMQKLNEKKQKFLDNIVPKWIDEAKKNGKLIEI